MVFHAVSTLGTQDEYKVDVIVSTLSTFCHTKIAIRGKIRVDSNNIIANSSEL